MNGFDYAYRYPGMNKVLQSAGRVIRTQEDTGIILLLDERFAGKDYRNLFPAEWSDRGKLYFKYCGRTAGKLLEQDKRKELNTDTEILVFAGKKIKILLS